ncbi:amidohydrolase family protein [Patescibacteria group bacterium]
MKGNLSFLDNIPLAELHTHLGFSVSPTMLWEMAHDQGLKLPVRKYFEFEKSITIYESKGYEEYIQMYDLTEKIQSSPDALFAAAQHAVSQAYRLNNITTLELRFNPVLRSRNNERDLDHLIVFCLQGLERAMLKYPVKAGIILMMDRRLTPQLNDVIVKKAIKYKARGVVGVDLAGPIERTSSSRRFKPKDIAQSVKSAKKAGLGVTVHTGEVTSLDEMWQVLEVLKPDRVAHGVMSYQDQEMMKYLSKNQIPLDTCPTSNLHTQVVKDISQMRKIYKAFIKHNVPFTISTDGPEMNRTSLRNEFKMLKENNILKEDEILKVNNLAHKVSFINKN